MQTTHTPGPWTVNGSDIDSESVRVGTFDSELPGEVHRANASLIASAPELLELVQWALDDGDSEIMGTDWAKAARAAIAKATA